MVPIKALGERDFDTRNIPFRRSVGCLPASSQPWEYQLELERQVAIASSYRFKSDAFHISEFPKLQRITNALNIHVKISRHPNADKKYIYNK